MYVRPKRMQNYVFNLPKARHHCPMPDCQEGFNHAFLTHRRSPTHGTDTCRITAYAHLQIVTVSIRHVCPPESIEWFLQDKVSCRRLIWLLPHLLPLSRQLARPATHRNTKERETTCSRERGERGGGRAKSCDGEKA